MSEYRKISVRYSEGEIKIKFINNTYLYTYISMFYYLKLFNCVGIYIFIN